MEDKKEKEQIECESKCPLLKSIYVEFNTKKLIKLLYQTVANYGKALKDE